MIQKCVEKQETEGSGYNYNEWIEFHIEMFPLRTFVGYKHHTPSILVQSVVNPNIDDNKYLQRCLILASEGGHKIIVNRKMGDESVYNKWWKQRDKYKVFGVTIHEIGEAKDICDNNPFYQSEEKFSRLEGVLNITLNAFEVTLLPGCDDDSKVRYEQFTSSQIYSGHKFTCLLSLFISNDTINTNLSPNTSFTSMTWPDSNNASISRMIWRIGISPKTRRAGSETSSIHIQLSKTMKYRYIEIR